LASFTLVPLGAGDVKANPLLELVLSTYEPHKLGVIDYHGPHRNYNRERLGSINLTIESTEERLRQHALYNYVNKYANLKAEMASAFIRHILGKQANPELRRSYRDPKGAICDFLPWQRVPWSSAN
jgi:hypothetical protein